MDKAERPIIVTDYWLPEHFDPDAVIVQENIEADNCSLYEVFISNYSNPNGERWRVRFKHIRVYGLDSRKAAEETAKSLVQAYLQGTYDA